jgi:Na+/phosphate symporter
MVKETVPDGETPHGKFKRIATKRTQAVLEKLRLLENCSNSFAYEYTDEEVAKIFETIEKAVKRVKQSFSKPVKAEEFRL